MKKMKVICFALVLLPTQLLANEVAATIARVVGEVVVFTAEGARRELRSGSQLFIEESIVTAKNAMASIEFTDGGRIDIGEYTRFELTEYAWNGDSGHIRSRVTKGIFQFFTGKIAARDSSAFKFSTRFATIGVRGTRFGGVLNERSGQVTLLKQYFKPKSSIIVSNDAGQVVLNKPGQITTLDEDGSSPSTPFGGRLTAIENLANAVVRVRQGACLVCPIMPTF